MQISNWIWCFCKLLMQNGLGNVLFTVCLVAFSCVGATHLSIRIFANTLWVISLGVCGGLCLLWWGPFLHCIPHEICKLCWEIEIVGVFYVWWLSAFSFWRISTKMRTFENPGGNLHRLHRRGLWCAKPKCSQRWPLANLAWASPLANSLEIALSNVWRLVCTNRYGFCTVYNRDWYFQKSNVKQTKKLYVGRGNAFQTSFLMRGGSLVVLEKCEAL